MLAANLECQLAAMLTARCAYVPGFKIGIAAKFRDSFKEFNALFQYQLFLLAGDVLEPLHVTQTAFAIFPVPPHSKHSRVITA